MIKISDFRFFDSIFRITDSYPTCCLKQWYLTVMCFNIGVILIYIDIKIPIIYHIELTCNIINIPLYTAQRKNCCRIFVLTFRNTDMFNPPYLIVLFIYIGVSVSWPRDLERIRLFHMKLWCHIHMIFCLISSSNNRILSLLTML